MKSIGVLVAMKDELAPLRKRYNLEFTGPGNFFTGKNRGMRLQFALSGAGPHRASEAMRKLVKYGQPDVLIGLGLSGGLSHDVGFADVILASSAQAPGQPTLDAALSLLPDFPLEAAPVLTLPTVLTTRAEKAEVAAVYSDCWAIDMETYSLAQAATAADIPWLSLRVISDAWNKDLPVDFNRYLDAEGQASILPLLKDAARNPRMLGSLMQFGKDVFRAREPLLKRFDEVLEVLAR